MKIADCIKDYVAETDKLKQKLFEAQFAFENGRITKKAASDRIRQIKADGKELEKQCEMFRNALESLPDEQQTVMYMKYFNSMGMANIAKHMRCSLPTVIKIHGDAIKNLKERG